MELVNFKRRSMNEKNTDQLLKLLDDLIKLVGKNTDHINKLAQEIADLKRKQKIQEEINEHKI